MSWLRKPPPPPPPTGLYAVMWIDRFGRHTVAHLTWQHADAEFGRRSHMVACQCVRIVAEDSTTREKEATR